MSRLCPVCQTPIDDDAATCPACNFRLTEATQEFSPVARARKGAPPAGEPDVHPVLRMVRGPQVGLEYPLDKDVVTLGRNPECDIFLNDMTVSREHAEVTRHADALLISDLHSFNGVWVNNRTVTQHALRPGDYVQIGKYDFVYEEHPADQPAR